MKSQKLLKESWLNMSKVKLRQANIDDIDLLSKMYCDMYDTLVSYGMPYRLNEETIQDIILIQLKARTTRFFVAETEKKLVGFVAVDVMRIDRKLDYDENNIMGHIKDIYVSYDARRANVASQLLKEAEGWAMENGASIVECNVIINNIPAQNFWSNNNYEVIGKIYCKKLD